MAEGTPGSERGGREPAIRTMRSDVSEFLKTTKPSLVSILVRQAQWDEYHPPSEKRTGLWLAAAGGVIMLAAGIWLIGHFLGPARNPPRAEINTPPPFLFFEETSDVTIDPTRQALRTAANLGAGDPPGSFRRLIIRIRENTGVATLPELPQFLEIAGGRLPAAFMESAMGPPQVFRYHSPAGRPELGIIMEVKNPARALQSLLTTESSLTADLAFLFSGALPPPALVPYQDVTYRNISLRYFRPDPNTDSGLGYLLFPARRLIVMATSENALRAAIDRLFERR